MRTIVLACVFAALLGCQQGAGLSSAAGAAPVPTQIKGRVVDDRGAGISGVTVLFHDTTRLSGHVDKRGCGTYHPQFSLTTDAEGRFAGELPFAPTRVQTSGRVEWVELPLPVTIADPKQELILTARTIPHRTLTGQVVDADGKPIAGASVLPDPRSGLALAKPSDDQGHFRLELGEPAGDTFRVRRMGYRPERVTLAGLERVVLATRRAMVTVTVLDNGAPVTRLVAVSLWQGGERLSFCTAGLASQTSEPRDGVCTLDAERGAVELRLDDKRVSLLQIDADTKEVTVEAPPRPAAGPAADGY